VSQNLSSASAPAYTPTCLSKIQAVGIVIAARNHSESLLKCIASIFAANSHSGWHQALWIVVVVDVCTDDAAKAAREALGAFGQVLEVSTSSVQTAYRIGASAIMEHFRNVPRHALLLTSTDATAELPCDWIDAQLKCSESLIGLVSSH
jgi:hypothetical protein